jgi:hypothetical protein
MEGIVPPTLQLRYLFFHRHSGEQIADTVWYRRIGVLVNRLRSILRPREKPEHRDHAAGAEQQLLHGFLLVKVP